MDQANHSFADEYIDQIIRNKFGNLDQEECEEKRKMLFVDIVSYALHHYVKGMNENEKSRVKELKERVSEEELIFTLLNELTSKPEILKILMNKYILENK